MAAVASAQVDSGSIEARISARPLADGRIEFALQLQDLDSLAADEGQTVWQERILPRGRNFPDEPAIGSWLSSRPPTLVGVVETRIRARRLEDGRTEFALQQKLDRENWGENILPSGRFISAAQRISHIDRWMNSTIIQLSTVIVIPKVVVPPGVPVVAEAVLSYADLDGYTWNGSEPSFYYGVRQDPLYDTYDTWVIKVSKTDDDLYDTLRLQLFCYAGVYGVTFWEDGLPYQSSSSRIRVSYRFDDGDVVTQNWSHYSGSDDGFYPSDSAAFATSMRTAEKLVVRATFSSHTITATFTNVNQMFKTRVQPNIEYCGHY